MIDFAHRLLWPLLVAGMAATLAMSSHCRGATESSPFPITHISPADVPAAFRGNLGEIIQAIRWKDITGNNIVVLSQTGEYQARDGSMNSRLYARQFHQSASGEWVPGWQLMDEAGPCNLDMLCAFVQNSLSLSDVDSDGAAEVSFVYRADCFGGMDPITQKLMVFHRGIKHAIRGRAVIFDADGHRVDPEHFIIDESFNNAPAALRTFAVNKWRRFENHRLPYFGKR